MPPKKASKPPTPQIIKFLKLFPNRLLAFVKHLLFPRTKFTLYDYVFKLSSRYLVAFIILIICFTFSYQILSKTAIDCEISETVNGKSKNPARFTYYDRISNQKTMKEKYQRDKKRMNNFCLNQGTFLVVKAMAPNMQTSVPYFGVSGYKKGVDEIIYQKYYKDLWGLLISLAFLAYLPHRLIKEKSIHKLGGIIGRTRATANGSGLRDEYLATVRYNGSFVFYYFSCKILTTLTPLISIYFSSLFIGYPFTTYGIDVVKYFHRDNGTNILNPMKVLFPLIAKCEKNIFGESGDFQSIGAICQLPLNIYHQWTLFVLWWMLMISFILTLLNLFHFLIFFVSSKLRCRQYKRDVLAMYDLFDYIEDRRTYYREVNGNIIRHQINREDVVKVNISFADWFVLFLIMENITDKHYRNFLYEIVRKENIVIWIKDHIN